MRLDEKQNVGTKQRDRNPGNLTVVVSDGPELMDIAVRLLNSVLNLPDRPDRREKVLEELKLQKNYNQSCSSNTFSRLVKMTLGLVNASYSLPKWLAQMACPNGFKTDLLIANYSL